MSPRSHRYPLAPALVLLAGATLLTACSTPESSGQTAVATESAASTQEAEAPTEAAGAALTLADVEARYAGCDAIGAVLGSALDGLEPSGDDMFGPDGVACTWQAPEGGDLSSAGIRVSIDPNGGADDLADDDTLALLDFERLPDAAVDAAGGIAYLAEGSGDLRSTATTVEVPGVTISVTHTALGADPTFVGDVAVGAMDQILGLS